VSDKEETDAACAAVSHNPFQHLVINWFITNAFEPRDVLRKSFTTTK
jgi:hypothetical protein